MISAAADLLGYPGDESCVLNCLRRLHRGLDCDALDSGHDDTDNKVELLYLWIDYNSSQHSSVLYQSLQSLLQLMTLQMIIK